MPAIAPDRAVEVLLKEIGTLEGDDLVAVYHEFYPKAKVPEDGTPLRERIVGLINQGVELDLLLDLWHMVFPTHRKVEYDEETETLQYQENYDPLDYDD